MGERSPSCRQAGGPAAVKHPQNLTRLGRQHDANGPCARSERFLPECRLARVGGGLSVSDRLGEVEVMAGIDSFARCF